MPEEQGGADGEREPERALPETRPAARGGSRPGHRRKGA
jgi:hypothetical protein